MRLRLSVQFFFVLIITSIVFYIYRIIQPVFFYDLCKLCDGNQYHFIYDYFKGNSENYIVAFPYYSRVVVPFLASLIPSRDLLKSFQCINLIFSALSAACIYYMWKKFEIPFYLIIAGLAWLLFHWTGLIRLNAADPLTADVPTYLVQVIFIFIVYHRKYSWLWLLAPIAVFQKESLNALIIVFAGWKFISTKHSEERTPWQHLIGPVVLSLVLKFIFTLEFQPVKASDKTAIETIVLSFVSLIAHPMKLVRWVVAAVTAFGPLLLLALSRVNFKIHRDDFIDFLACMSLTYLGLGLLAGGDMTRIIFLGFPFLMTWILLTLKDIDIKELILPGILSLLMMRISEIIPDPGKDFPTFTTWYPEFADKTIVFAWLGYFIFCYLLIMFQKRLFNRNL